jgi:pimeloyl-ACP methyl ester carboxylesterase
MVKHQGAVIRAFTQSDGYKCHYRLWGQSEGNDVVVLLHGGISHSGWQEPLADAIVSKSEISFIALDRRGSGLNTEGRGHLLSKEREIEDVVSFIRSLQGSYSRIHLAGWCFGGQVAAIVASQLDREDILSSFILIAPGFAFNERYSDVLRLSMQSVFEVIKEFGVNPESTHAFIPVPLQPTDFTTRSEWHDFIVKDEHRLAKVTERTLIVWYELADWSSNVLSEIARIPVLAIFGSQDRLVENDRVKQILKEQVKSAALTIDTLDTGHAVQFEEPEKLAEIMTRFVSSVPRRMV